MVILTEDKKVLKEKFDTLKVKSIESLNKIISDETDDDVKSRIQETITKLTSESFTELGYYKLTKLNENL